MDFLDQLETFKAQVRVGTTHREDVVFCGLQISNKGDNIDVTVIDSDDLMKAVMNWEDLEVELTNDEEP